MKKKYKIIFGIVFVLIIFFLARLVIPQTFPENFNAMIWDLENISNIQGSYICKSDFAGERRVYTLSGFNKRHDIRMDRYVSVKVVSAFFTYRRQSWEIGYETPPKLKVDHYKWFNYGIVAFMYKINREDSTKSASIFPHLPSSLEVAQPSARYNCHRSELIGDEFKVPPKLSVNEPD